VYRKTLQPLMKHETSNKPTDQLSHRLSVTNIASSFLFLDGIQPFIGHQFDMTKTTKRCSSYF